MPKHYNQINFFFTVMMDLLLLESRLPRVNWFSVSFILALLLISAGNCSFQEITTTRGEGTKIVMTGTSTGAVMRFEGGLLTTLLPGGMGLTSPGSVGQSVGRKQAFYFEFSWIQSPEYRRRLVRTYDTDGLVVSTSLATESKILQQ